MEINHLLKDVLSLNEYITVTQNVMNKSKNLNVSINITTVLTLKKIQTLEIEYFNKCDENGVACIIFDRLLGTPPSKVWGVLAKELVSLLQYWLEAIRKHLIDHSTLWWMFLKLILHFIKEIRLKYSTIPNMLVELTAECLFNLATAPRPDVFQRHEILHCLNMVCAESGREIRFAMRTNLGDYFVKIAAQMATSGYLPYQYSALECLLRWLVPRQERSLRASAADKWLPRDLCPQTARTLFLNSTWMNFFQDARDFLNALNAGNGLVTSVICRRLCIGEIVIINGTERQQSWLDFNTSGKSISVLLDPRVLGVFGVTDHRACETFVIDNEITEAAILRRESLGLTISLNMLRAPYIRPTDINTGDGRNVSIVVSSRADLRTLDGAMRSTFGEKYQLLLDLDANASQSQSPNRVYKSRNELVSEEETRFSHPVEVKKRKQSGYIVRSRHAGALNSPSSTSTSSLIQLKDRLAALPRFKFDREPVSVCAQPALSNVSELTERDDRSTYTTSTLKFQPFGVCHKNFKTPCDQKTSSNIKSSSDGQIVKQKFRGGRRLLSPVASDDNSTSLLLVATVGSNDSVINETIERLSKSKDFQDDNIVDLLVKEALQAKQKSRGVSDSGINTDEKKSQEVVEAIDDTPTEIKHSRNKAPLKKHGTIISKSTTDDESNTEAINETPFVNPRKNIRRHRQPLTEIAADTDKQTFHVKTIDEFFSQHIAENKRCEIVISPTLAKKINETSSETSENFDNNDLHINEDPITDVELTVFDDIAIIDCLNDMVDKVCSDFNKYTEYLYLENTKPGTSQSAKVEEVEDFKGKSLKTLKQTKAEIQKPKRNIKLRYNPTKKTKACVAKKTKNVEQESLKKMSIIIEQKEDEINQENDNEGVETVKAPENKFDTPSAKDIKALVARRKRKLYSPKDENTEEETHDSNIENTSDHISLSEIKTRKKTVTAATCYKELEKDRKKYTRSLRSKGSKAKFTDIPSPRTLKNNSIFENLKQTVESNEKITLVDKDTGVYNFHSDSDDEDFKMKMEINKRASKSTKVEASTIKKRRNTCAKEYESPYEELSKAKPMKRKKVVKPTKKPDKQVRIDIIDLVDKDIDLVDERMREAPVAEVLNTSILIEHSVNLEPEVIEPILKQLPQMEEIVDLSDDTMVSKKNAKMDQVECLQDSKPNNKIVSKKNTTKAEMTPLHDGASNDKIAPKRPKRNNRAKITDVERKDIIDKLGSTKKVTRSVNKRTELLKIKKEKGLAKKDKNAPVFDKDDDSTASPLPGLVVESTPEYKEDINESLTTNMLQKFKRIYQAGPDAINDSVNTQNMLSDVDKFNNSAQNWINIGEELCFVDKTKENISTNTEKKNQKRKHVEPEATKYNTRQKNMNKQVLIETKDICVNDNQPEQSISSDGITAHGDFKEEPPNPETIGEKLQPREVHDLSQSMQDYFNKLTHEIHNTASKDSRSSKSVEDEEVSTVLRNQIYKAKSAIFPVIPVKRLSYEDISKWMPSRRTSHTDSPLSSPKTEIQTKQVEEYFSNSRNQMKRNVNSAETTPKSGVQAETVKCKETLNSESSVTLKSPVVPTARISLEEFDKWLPMPSSFEAKQNGTTPQKNKNSDLEPAYRTRSKSTFIDSIIERDAKLYKAKDKITEELAGNKPKRAENYTHSDHVDSKATVRQLRNKSIDISKHNISKSDSEDNTEDELAIISIKTRNTTLEKEPSKESNKPNKTTNEKNIKNLKTKTVVDSDESLTKNMCIEKEKPIISPIKVDNFASNIENNSSDENECLKKIRSIFAKTKTNRRCSVRDITPESRRTSTYEETSINKPPLKRKPMPSIPSERKKALLDPNISVDKFESKVTKDVAISDSGPSVSSVSDWFKKAGPMDQNDDITMSYKDTLQNIMEKIDTSLVELNENMSKKFVNQIIEAQKNINEQREGLCEQAAAYKQVVKGFVTGVVRDMEGMIAELNNIAEKSQTKDNDFTEKFKKQAFDAIRNDCKQKRAMVLLLKEDVQAVIDHMERNRRPKTP